MNDTSPNPPPSEDNPALAIRHGFAVGLWNLLIPQGGASELLDKPEIFPLPFSPPGFAGMINRRGEVVPVFSLPLLLEPSAASETFGKNKQWVVILGEAPKLFGLLIDHYPQLLNRLEAMPLADIFDLPDHFKLYVTAAYRANNKYWLDFNFENWLVAQNHR